MVLSPKFWTLTAEAAKSLTSVIHGGSRTRSVVWPVGGCGVDEERDEDDECDFEFVAESGGALRREYHLKKMHRWLPLLRRRVRTSSPPGLRAAATALVAAERVADPVLPVHGR